MPAPVILGENQRLAQLLKRLPELGVPVLPLDYERIFQVFAPGRRLEWTAARELLVTLLAKDIGNALYTPRVPPPATAGGRTEGGRSNVHGRCRHAGDGCHRRYRRPSWPASAVCLHAH